ncbi:hypothetical protein K402DRAFT_437761 [Aulographum hederae CBS 113979]|uniref:Uncharacterized protein n=1 Tax=Aulographum hederae CBS 113979 TaxID=1176131 RepID=A0A6G1GPJ4_9PEZI|nr:hypothetical protein K402DRAFT_437761 [Aulographum hederae CBS 113979]
MAASLPDGTLAGLILPVEGVTGTGSVMVAFSPATRLPNVPSSPVRLSEAALAGQNERWRYISQENYHIESQIRVEGIQDYHRALAARRPFAEGNVTCNHDQCQCDNIVTPIDLSLQLFRPPETSSQNPCYRYATWSTADEPFPLLARFAMEEANLGHGDMESATLRKRSAERMVNESNERVPRSPLETSRGRVRRDIRKRKRSSRQRETFQSGK